MTAWDASMIERACSVCGGAIPKGSRSGRCRPCGNRAAHAARKVPDAVVRPTACAGCGGAISAQSRSGMCRLCVPRVRVETPGVCCECGAPTKQARNPRCLPCGQRVAGAITRADAELPRPSVDGTRLPGLSAALRAHVARATDVTLFPGRDMTAIHRGVEDAMLRQMGRAKRVPA